MEYSASFARRKKTSRLTYKAAIPENRPDRPRAILAQYFIARRAPRPIVHRSATLSRHGAKRHFSSASAGGKSAHNAERARRFPMRLRNAQMGVASESRAQRSRRRTLVFAKLGESGRPQLSFAAAAGAVKR